MPAWIRTILTLIAAVALLTARARQLGVPFEGAPGPLNAITDVAGLEVGHTTLISGDGKQAVRTGVTAVWPRGKQSGAPVFGGWFSLNGNGEMTGTTWVEESGLLDEPVMITNTHSVGTVRDSYIKWRVVRARKAGIDLSDEWSLPVVAETWDGFLNDINGFHVQEADAFAALEAAKGGPVAEGNVGGGTGMVCYGFKGGIGTSSRKAGAYTVGVLVQCNCGRRAQLRIAGVPVGQEITGIDHHRGGHRRSAAATPDEAPGAARIAGCGAHRLEFRQRFRRHLHRVFDGECGRRAHVGTSESDHGAQRRNEQAVRGHRGGHRGGHRQRHGGGRDDDRLRGAHGDRAAARSAAGGFEEVRPAGAVTTVMLLGGDWIVRDCAFLCVGRGLGAVRKT